MEQTLVVKLEMSLTIRNWGEFEKISRLKKLKDFIQCYLKRPSFSEEIGKANYPSFYTLSL